MSKKVLVSGIQASGTLHIGNYFGALRQNIELANSDVYESYLFIADYHALTTVKNGDALRRSTREIVASYIACGLDSTKTTLFKQSDIKEHAELCVILNNVVTMPYLMRAHAFKDNEAKNKEVNVGLFDYPVLMAADILMYKADIVPVGEDQRQHLEYARDIAGFFNRAWGSEVFPLPEAYIVKDVATVLGIDGEKMSKSKGNVIGLFASDEEVKKSVMSIQTDSASREDKKNADENIIYQIHSLFLNDEEKKILRAKFENGGYGYKDAKEALLVSIMEWRKGKKEIYDELLQDTTKIDTLLEKGKAIAQARANKTAEEVRTLIGLA